MKGIYFFAASGVLAVFIACSTPPVVEPPTDCTYFFETVMDSTISASTPAKIADLKCFRQFSLLARFEGQANESFDFEIGFNRTTVYRETVELNAAGWANFAKVYPVYAPRVGIAIYHPPANTKVKMSIYAGH